MDTRYWYCVKPVIKEIIYQLKENNVKKMAAQTRPAKKVLFMNIEEKAKAYDEALEKVKPLYERAKKDDSPIWATYEHLFPQLAESEDERIRRDIIHYILYKADGVSEEQEHSWIAYLEKQKEQKPAEWSDSFEENIRNLLHDKLTWHSDDGSISTTVFIDDKTIKDIVMGIWFYVGKEAMKNPNMELPKEEWSEEDEEDNIYLLLGMVDAVDSIPYISGTLRVSDEKKKELKEFIKRSSWKPSENIDIYEVAYERYPINNRLVQEVTKDINEDTRDGFIDGYKYCDSTRWKPSEEQMRYLLAVINDQNNIGAESCYMNIKSLYNDLKKL